MTHRTWLMPLLVALALAVGSIPLFLWNSYPANEMVSVVFPGYPAYRNDYPDRHEEYLRARYLRDFPALGGTAEDYLALSSLHPGRPWYGWMWWHKKMLADWRRFASHPGGGEVRIPEGAILAEAGEFAAGARRLAEMDSDNGYPLYLLAYAEARNGAELRQDRRTGEKTDVVVDAERLAQAALLLHDAVSRERFTAYGGELGAEWLAVMGRPESLADAVVVNTQLAGIPVHSLWMPRLLGRALVADARRRLEAGADDESVRAAYATLDDLQTFGARLATGGHSLIDQAVGQTVVSEVTEGGAEALAAAGRPAEAERLADRGRRLLRPRLLARLMLFDIDSELSGENDLDVMQRDPELLAEAKRLRALRREAGEPSGDTVDRAGYFAGGFYSVDMSMPWTRPPFSLEEFKAAGRFEAVGLQKIFLFSFLRIAWIVLAVLAAAYAVRKVRGRGGEPAGGIGLSQAFGGAACFGLCAALPALAAACAGNVLWSYRENFVLWLVFLNLWGMLAGGVALTWWTERAAATPGAGEAQSAGRAARVRTWPRKFVVSTLILSLVPAVLGWYAGVATTGSHGLFSLNAMWRHHRWWFSAVLLLAPAAFAVLAAIVAAVRGLLRNDRVHASRLVPGLAGLAGGMLLWFGSAFVLDWQEREWGRGDTLIVPRMTASGEVRWLPSETRIMEPFEAHLRAVLRDEGKPSQ